tara:strand:+ start:681 stop:788 length:108 start_codon:yes stop_codon:yes gene_type:complete
MAKDFKGIDKVLIKTNTIDLETRRAPEKQKKREYT